MNPILLNLLLFSLVLFLYYKKGKHSGLIKYNILGAGSLIAYVVYSVFAFLLSCYPEFRYSSVSGSGHFSYEATIFLFCGLLLWLIPFIRGEYSGFKMVKMSKEMNWLFTILIICGIVEIILYIPHAIHGYSLMEIDIATIREEGHELGGKVGNAFTGKFVMIYDLFNTIIPLGVFYYIIQNPPQKVKSNILTIIYFLIALLKTMTTGSRDNFVFPLINFVVAFLIFYPIIDKTIKKRIIIALGGIGGFVFLVSVWMSFYRFENSGFSPVFHVISYVGQGIVQFNCRMYDYIDVASWGDFNFAFYREILGLDYSATNDIRREHWATILRYPTNIFYTHFGSYVIDFGKIGAIIFSFIVLSFVSSFTRIKGPVIHFSQLIILATVARIVYSGGFYYIECSWFGGYKLLIIFLLCMFLRYTRNS